MTEPEKKIKVLYVCPWAHRTGHAPQAVKNEPLALLEAGAELSVCTFRGVLDQQETPAMPHFSVVSTKTRFPLNILARLLNAMPGGTNVSRLLEQVSTLCLAANLRRRLRYDILYLRDADPFVFVPFLIGCFIKNRNLVCSLLGTKSVRSPGSLYHKLIDASAWKPVYRRALYGNQYAFVCENGFLKDYFERKFLDGILSGKVNVVPLGMKKTSAQIDQREARQYLGLPEERTIFLHFGFLHQDKNIETVLAAIKSIPPALLVHAGKIDDGTDLAHLVSCHGLQDKVIIKDCYIPETEKQYYFSAADAIILSYMKDFLLAGSMLLEAVRFKLPAISSDNGDLGELVHRYKIGLVFTAEDVASLSSTLLDFLDSSHSQRKAMANNCERFCDDFSFNTWAHRYIKIFTDLCVHTSKEN